MSDHRKPRKSNPSSSSSSQTLTLIPPFLRPSRRLLILPSIFFLSLTFILLTIFSRSHSPSPPPPQTPRPKIFLYETPRRFTHGVVENYLRSRGRPPSPPRYPGHQHSAEWHLLADLLNPRRPPSSPLRRVADPAQADLFFVPFFSSLSLAVNPARGTNSSYSDEEMQERVAGWVEGQEFWRRSGGRDHVFVCQDPNAMYRVIDRVRNAVLLVSDFGRLRGGRASLVKDVVLPYAHRINAFGGGVGVEGRGSLLFFMGNRYRKEVSLAL